MPPDLTSWIPGNKTKKRVLRETLTRTIGAAAGAAAKANPVVKTIQAGYNIIQLGNTIRKADETASHLNEFVPKATELVGTAHQFVPSIQVMGRSLCDSLKLFGYFSTIATTVGIGSNIILTYQGVQALNLIATRLKDINDTLAAQTALMAQREFPELVYYMIRERLAQTSQDPEVEHWFYVFHPDTDWYPKFFHLIETNPLDPRFCGYTNQIDTVFVFMLATRRYIEKKNARSQRHGKPPRPVRLHLLIPAYQPILIAEALKIPDEIGDFVIEGRIHNNRELVWFNLPEEQKHYTMDIGQWLPPERGWWSWAMTKFGLKETPPELKERRMLGTRQGGPEDKDESVKSIKENGEEHDIESDSALSKRQGNDEKAREQGKPLHHRQRPQEKRRR